MHPKVKLLIEMGTNKLKQDLSYAKNMVNKGVSDMKRKLDDLKAPGINTSRLSAGYNSVKTLVTNTIGFFKSKLFPAKVDAPGINTNPFQSGIASLKRMALAAGIGALITGGIGTSISYGMDAVKNKTSFEVLGGKAKGDKLFTDTTKFAQESIFGNEVYDNAKTLLGFGVAIDDVMPRLKMLGDISMGDKEHFNSLTLAFAQMTAAGRLMGQDVLQFVNAGFNPLKEISDMTGESMASLKKKMEDGQISTALVNKAFEHATAAGGKFYKMTEKIGETAFGKWEAMKGQLQGIAMQFGLALLPSVIKVFDAVKPLMDMLPAALAKITPVIEEVFGIGARVLDMVKPVFELFNNADFSGLFTEIKGGINTILDAVGPAILELLPLFGTVLDVVWPLMTQIREMTLHLVQKLAPTLKNVAHILTNILGPALRIVGWVLGKIIDVIGWVVDKVADILNFVTGLLSKISDGVKWLMDTIGITVDDGATKIVNAMQNKIKDNNVVRFFKEAGEKHGQAYLDALFMKYEKAAAIMDALYHTKAWSNSVKNIKEQVTGGKKKKEEADGLNPESVKAGGTNVSKDTSGTPTKIAGKAEQTHNISIRFDSYIKGDVISNNQAIAKMSKEELDRWLREHFYNLIYGVDPSY